MKLLFLLMSLFVVSSLHANSVETIIYCEQPDEADITIQVGIALSNGPGYEYIVSDYSYDTEAFSLIANGRIFKSLSSECYVNQQGTVQLCSEDNFETADFSLLKDGPGSINIKKMNCFKLTLKHPYAYFEDSKGDADTYSTSLGLLKSVDQLSDGNFVLEVYLDNKISNIELLGSNKYSEYWDEINSQIKDGHLIIYTGSDSYHTGHYDPELVAINSKIKGLVKSLEFTKKIKLKSNNLSLFYEHAFPFNELKQDKGLDQDLYSTYMGKVNKVIVDEMGPEYRWVILTIYSSFYQAEIQVKKRMFGLMSDKVQVKSKKIKSKCETVLDKKRAYSLLKEIVSNEGNTNKNKNISCSNKKVYSTDILGTNLPGFSNQLLKSVFKENQNNKKLF